MFVISRLGAYLRFAVIAAAFLAGSPLGLPAENRQPPSSLARLASRPFRRPYQIPSAASVMFEVGVDGLG